MAATFLRHSLSSTVAPLKRHFVPWWYAEKKTTSLLSCEGTEKAVSSFEVVNRKAVGLSMVVLCVYRVLLRQQQLKCSVKLNL